MEQIYIPQQDYKVFVSCMTFNQSKYIEDALNGFAMQQTDFPFVCLVMDDCSTDGEQEVIKAWLNEHCDMDKVEYVDLELANVILAEQEFDVYSKSITDPCLGLEKTHQQILDINNRFETIKNM